jgi:hypothetical protein
MNMRDQHATRTFVFRPGEVVHLLLHEQNKKVKTRLSVESGKKLRVRVPGPMRLAMPQKGMAEVKLLLVVDFKERPEKLHLDPRGVHVQIVGSEGTFYHYRVNPGPSHSQWHFRIASIPKGKVLHFCLHPRCQQRGRGIETRGKGRICRACRKSFLVPFGF